MFALVLVCLSSSDLIIKLEISGDEKQGERETKQMDRLHKRILGGGEIAGTRRERLE